MPVAIVLKRLTYFKHFLSVYSHLISDFNRRWLCTKNKILHYVVTYVHSQKHYNWNYIHIHAENKMVCSISNKLHM